MVLKANWLVRRPSDELVAGSTGPCIFRLARVKGLWDGASDGPEGGAIVRKLIINEQLSLDGVMQGPGQPDEDRSGGFEHGGWAMTYFDEIMGKAAGEGMGTADGLLLGRKTYEIFAAYWPEQGDDVPFAGFLNSVPKYVASQTLREPLEWN